MSGVAAPGDAVPGGLDRPTRPGAPRTRAAPHQGYDDPIRAWLTGARESGPGLTGLTDRVDALAGTMRLVSPPGCGTRLRVRLRISPGSGRGREGGKSGEAMQQVDDGDRTAITTGH